MDTYNVTSTKMRGPSNLSKRLISLASNNNFPPLFKSGSTEGLKGREHLGDISVEDRIILKWILKIWDM
jgi:hypothetical protein